jgi:PKD repeat protein
MNKFTLLFFCLCLNVFGQSTYTAANFASVGDSFFITTPTTAALQLDYTVTGTNFAWDYSTLVPNTQETRAWSNPNTSGYKTVWCLLNGYLFNCNTQFNNNFNLSTQLTEGLVIQGMGLTNVVDHLNKSTSGLQNKMIGAQVTVNGSTLPLVVSYSDPDDIYQFPMTFGATATNPYAINTDLTALGVPVQIVSTGQRTNLVEGWGTLVTPFGTFSNVLKLKSTLVQNTTITYNGTPQTTSQTTVSYQWFDPAYKIPVLDATGNLVNNVWTPTSVTFMDYQRCLTPQASFVYYPIQPDYNPATPGAVVNFINTSSNYDISDWDFGDGTPHSSIKSPNHTYTCPGVKMVTLTITNQFCDPDQIETITLPITITDSQNIFTNEVTVTATDLTAVRSTAGTTYQWLDCDNNNAPIAGANTQVFTPQGPGNYAVQLTTNGCVSISDCYSFTMLNATVFESDQIKLVPNPTDGNFVILGIPEETIQSLAIYDLVGKRVATTADLTGLVSGIYILKIKTNQGLLQKKIIKQ